MYICIMDETLEQLKKNVEEMDKKDKTGMSFVDIYRPYSMLYNYVMIKIGVLTDKEEIEKLTKTIYG